MDIYRVDVVTSESNHTYLIEASSAAKARAHVYRVVRVRSAKQEDMRLAIGEDAIEIEVADE